MRELPRGGLRSPFIDTITCNPSGRMSGFRVRPAVAETQWRGFQFRPIPGPVSGDATRDFVGRLRRVLRAAHGLALPLRLKWFSGLPGGVELSVSPPVGVRWAHFGFSSAYEPGQWQATEGRGREVEGTPEFAVSLGNEGKLPLPSGEEDAPWCDAVLRELSTIRSGVEVEWIFRPDPEVPGRSEGEWSASEPKPEGPRNLTFTERDLNDRQEARRIGLRWRVQGRILSDGNLENREAARRVAHLIEVMSHLDGGNRFACRPIRYARFRTEPYAAVTEAELVGLFPLPSTTAEIISPLRSAGESRLWVGRDPRGSCIGLPFDAVQGRHLLILGETGMGKSSLLVRLAWQAARWGSVMLFDPIGDTAREFLAGLPDSRAPDVSWVSPSTPALTLSLLAEVASGGGQNSARRERLLGDIVAALRRVRSGRYAESVYWGPRLEEMLFQAIRATSHWPGASLAVAEQLLTPEGFSSRVVPETAREAVGDLRRRIERAPQDGDGARRLLSEITRSEILREMLDATSPTWSVDAAMRPGRMTVISGDAPQVGESVARYLLAVVLALSWNAVLGREPPSKTFLILDEAQWYAHDSVAEMLRLGRRFNLHVWAVTQSLRSLPEDVRDAATTNSADVVLFRGDPSDARDVARWVPSLAPERILSMPRGEAALLVDKGSRTHWVHVFPPRKGTGDPNRFRAILPVNEPVEPSREEGNPLVGSPATGDALTRPVRSTAPAPFFDALRDLLSRADTRPEFTVHLSEFRSRWPDTPALADRWVRSGGRLLSLNGALVRTGKDDAGSFWVLSRERLTIILRSAPGPSSNGSSEVEGEAGKGNSSQAEAS